MIGDMRIGAVFPQTEIGTDPAHLKAWAQAVEDLGYQHIVAFDHVVGAGTDTRPGWAGFTSEHPFHEVFVLFGFLAAVTTTIELATGVLIVPQRQTVLVAKQAAEVDVLSGGRLRLGVGIGWNQVEYEALGESFNNRGARSAEQVELLRELWAAPTVNYAGRWHSVDNAGINPRPAAGRIPVWFGGQAEATLRRIARSGDGWLAESGPAAAARAKVERIRWYATQAGRDPDEIGLEPRLSLAAVPQPERASYVAAWQELGATHFSVNTMGLHLSTVDDHITALEHAIHALLS
jgi:probable F420-dependent oxidoreductase